MAQAIMCEYCERGVADHRAAGIYPAGWYEVREYATAAPQHFCSLLHLLAWQAVQLRSPDPAWQMVFPGVTGVQITCYTADMHFWASTGSVAPLGANEGTV